MERARHQPRRDPRPPAVPGLSGQATITNVRVIWGPFVQEVQVQDLTVEQAFRVLEGPFNIQPGVEARVNGETARRDRQLAAGDTLEFVHRSGEKGARAPEVRIVGEQVTALQGRKPLATVPVETFAALLSDVAEGPFDGGLLPRGVRYWQRRGDTVALAVEVPPHTRSVRWLEDGSKRPYGRGARYQTRFLAFPFVVLLLVFRDRQLTGWQQLYYRTASLDVDEQLLLPNLYNVAKGYGQRCWVCLQHLRDVSELDWSGKIDAIVDHVFTAAWNRSSEEHEGNSYWGAMKDLDARLASPRAWADETKRDPLFPLQVAWKPAGTTLREELRSMLDQVAPARTLRSAADFAGLVTAAQARVSRS